MITTLATLLMDIANSYKWVDKFSGFVEINLQTTKFNL